MTDKPIVNDRPIVYLSPDNNIPTYRASALGSCLRALWAARSGMEAKPPPDHMLKVFAQGTNLESTILDLLYNEHNFTFQDGGAQKTVTLDLHVELPSGTLEHVRVTGHVDQYGCIADPALSNADQLHFPIDVKAFAQSTVDNYRTKGLLAFPHYAWQQSVYALGLGHLKFYMPIYNKDTQRIEPWSLDPIAAPYDEQAIAERIALVESAFINSTIPDCTLNYPCPFYYLHDDEKPTNTPLSPNVDALISARIKIDHKIAVLTTAKKTLSDKISSQLPVGSFDSSLHPDYSISIIPNPDRFNTAAAKSVLLDAGVDITDSEFVIKGVGNQLRVVPPKPAKKEASE